MKYTNLKPKGLILLLTLIIASSCKSDVKEESPLKYGEAIFSGKIIGDVPDDEKTEEFVIMISNAITGEETESSIRIGKEGDFRYTIYIEAEKVLSITSPIFTGGIPLIPGEETRLEIEYNNGSEKQMRLTTNSEFNIDDARNITDAMIIMAESYRKSTAPDTPNHKYVELVKGHIAEIEDNPNFSNKVKEYTLSEQKMWYAFEEHNDIYLKFADMNNPHYLITYTYPLRIVNILQNERYDIKPIGDTKIEDWIKDVKEALSSDLGTDTGMIYDLLASNSYGLQIRDMKPLTEKQKENIEAYFVNDTYKKSLFEYNDRLEEVVNSIDFSYTINDTPTVANEKIMDAIIAKHKGKVVFVDLWATWCGPCKAAFKEMLPLKGELQTKDVVFVFISPSSSPKDAWSKEIATMGGEHYYLEKEEQWYSILDQYGFKAIPSYLIFDKDGKLSHKQTGFMGVDKMKELVEQAL